MTSWFTRKERLLAGTIVAGASLALLAEPAFAQDAAAPSEAAGAEEEIVVTGSRIPRANVTAPTAVTTVDQEVIELSGLSNVAEILRAVPSFGVSALSANNSNFLTTNSGVNTLELRELDEERTLVLLNGRRYVAGVPGSSAVDFNTIPVDMIERVEIITGGASAIYGADALAGVINIITRDDFEGVEYRYQYGESSEGDDVRHRVSFLAGGNFADGRGNAVLTASYTQDQGVLARDRANTAIDDIALCVLTGDTADCQTPVEPFFSSFSERGRFFDFSTGESLTIDDNGDVVPFATAQHGFNRQHFRRYSTPIERFLISGQANYEINSNVETYAELMFAHAAAKSELEPFPHAQDDLSIDGVPCDNPFVPADMVAQLCDDGDTHIPYSRRMTEIGQRGNDADRNTFRALLGFRGQFGKALEWDAYYAYGRSQSAQRTGGQINVSNMREALNAVDGDDDPLTFDPVCANPAAVAEGCVPINLFGIGSISEEAADYVRAPALRDALIRQELIGATLGGPLFAAPAGDVRFAVGAEWRREYSQDIPDALTQTGQNALNRQEPIIGGYHVGEVFLELEAPLLRDLPLVHELTIGGAYRWSDYSTLGETEAYTGRISWAPIEPLRFRAQYARAVRAPNIGELFAPAGENFAPVADPCNGVTAADDPSTSIDDNCRSIPAIAARIAATGSFTLTQPEIQGTGGFTGGGNPNLNSETSDSYSVGAVFVRDFGAAGNLMASVDWYQIEIQDLIATVGRQEAIDFCFDTPTSAFPNAFCSLLVRDAVGPAFQQGELIEVNSTFINEGSLTTSGLDVSFSWSFTPADWMGGVPGDVSLRFNYTHLFEFDVTQFGQPDDLKGEVGTPEDKWQGAIIYTLGPATLQWETTFVGDAVPDNAADGLFNFNVGKYVVHDARIGFDIFENANIYFGANNILDEEAPIVLSGVPGNSTGTDTNASVYDPIGRTFFAGVRLRY